MTEREFQINVERKLQIALPGYGESVKFPSDLLFYFINQAKDLFVQQCFNSFQQNQTINDSIQTLIKTQPYTSIDFVVNGKRWEATFPKDYVHTVGENVYISINNDKCPNLITKETDVIEATIDTVSAKLNNSLSDHHLRYNQAKPIRVYTDNKIVLYTDGNYDISSYELVYLKKASDLGKYENLRKEYTDLPESVHQTIVDIAIEQLLQTASTMTQKSQTPEQKQEQQ